jgi:ATPase family associated with various cellular activities (AAA)
MSTVEAPRTTAFSPALRAEDEVGAHWLRQVAFRLRREVAWRWHQRRELGREAELSPASERLVDSLELVRHWEAKQRYFAEDSTARYLSERLAEPLERSFEPPRGSFGWVADELELDEVSTFALALGLVTAFDSASAPIVAACLNDPGRTQPNLELAQRLWDQPEEALRLSDPFHLLWRLGLLEQPAAGHGAPRLGWETPLVVPPLVASRLLFPLDRPTPVLPELVSVAPSLVEPEDVELALARLEAERGEGLRIVPVLGRPGADYRDAVVAVAAAAGLGVRRLLGEPDRLEDPVALRALFALAWLIGDALFLDSGSLPPDRERGRFHAALGAAREVPVTLFCAMRDRSEIAGFPSALVLPALVLPPMSYDRRAAWWHASLESGGPTLDAAISECARRFRYEQQTIAAVAEGLNRLGRAPTRGELLAACRAEIQVECGNLAQRVEPRFEDDELVLPPDRRLQLEEIHKAMSSLTEVHYEWGTARAWNEGGISVLFAGPPGTGKTMAAEVLARRLDMPMFRIDLSQVVDKYIGVTEKNLKRLFDAADVSDLVLFFDEADALFGRRTEVRDAHDRYANLEISYLLERMERFKGLAILATNRRKDLDEAFLRRLRFIVEFPLPDIEQREEIWRKVIPPRVDASDLDLAFLARQFPLAGGHIRSIVFNACLQSAGRGAEQVLTMERVIVAVKREYDKLKRSVSLEQFGPYAPLVEGIGE